VAKNHRSAADSSAAATREVTQAQVERSVGDVGDAGATISRMRERLTDGEQLTRAD